jgi:signal peptidase I
VATAPVGALGSSATLTYVLNECTWFVAKTLSWIPGGLGDAKNWLANGKAKGVPTGTAPVAGDVIVFKNISPYDKTAGHVAIVQSVNADWSIVVQEMNFTNGLGKTDTRTISKSSWLTTAEGFLVSPQNAQVIPMAFGMQGSKQSLADMALAGGGSAVSGTNLAPGPSTPSGFDFSALQKLLTFITDPKEWWRILIVAVGVVLIFIGVTGYFAPRAAKVAPIPA